MAGKTLTIILSTTIPGVFIIALAAAICFYVRRRRSGIFNRGITPIADEEIESWRVEKNDEKESDVEHGTRPLTHQHTNSNGSQGHHHHNSSVSSAHKPPSVIVYHNVPYSYQTRMSGEHSPKSLGHKRSVDLPQTPVLARAPNSRPGLTDDTIQGDDAYLPQVKRQTSRLGKLHNSNGATVVRPQHNRHRSAHTGLGRERWHGQQEQADDYPLRTRQSADNIPRRDQRGHERIYSAGFAQPRMSLEETTMPLVGLPPQPVVHRSEIGRAIG